MKPIKLVEPACRKVLGSLDSYIDNELQTETNLDLADHLRTCRPCAEEAEEREKMRTRIRSAVHDVSVPSDLERRVRESLRQSQQSHGKKIYLMAIAAMIVVCFASAFALRSRASAPLSAILRVGFDQHLHCAVIRQRNNRPAHAVDKLSPQFHELVPIVEKYVPARLPLSIAHECSYEGRKFVHLTFRQGTGLLSVVIARKQDGESLHDSRLTPVLFPSGVPVYADSAGHNEVSAFETDRFLVYTVSELSRSENLKVLTALAPALHDFLQHIAS